VRRILRILRVTFSLLSLLLCAASVVLWIRSHLAPPAAATGLVNLKPDPDRWSLYAQSGKLFLLRERSILDPADVPRVIKSGIDQRSLLGFGTERWQKSHNWPVDRGTLTYGSVLNAYFCPLWSCVIVFLVLPLVELPRITRNFRRRRRGLCVNCGYDLRASPTKCPECGALVQRKKNEKIPLAVPR
jgi:hypothetical protein